MNYPCPRWLPFITRWFGTLSWVRYAGLLAKPCCKHRLFGVIPAVGNEAREGFPPTAIWRKTTSAGSARLKQASPPWRPHIRIQNVFWMIGSRFQPLFIPPGLIGFKVMGLFYVHPPAISRSRQIKRARWPKMDLVSRENVLESYKLANDAARCCACSVGTRSCVCVCMRRDECSGTPHWPVGCDSVTGQGAFEYAGAMQDE